MRPKFSRKTKYVRTDAWRGYSQPIFAIAGVNDTGEWSDSPNRGSQTVPELFKFRHILRRKGIHTRMMTGQTSNVFAFNHFLIVPPNEFMYAKLSTHRLLSSKKRRWSNVWSA